MSTYHGGWGTPIQRPLGVWVTQPTVFWPIGSGSSRISGPITTGFSTRIESDTTAITTSPAPVTRPASGDPWAADVSSPYPGYPGAGYSAFITGTVNDVNNPRRADVNVSIVRHGDFSATPPDQTADDVQAAGQSLAAIDLTFGEHQVDPTAAAFTALFDTDITPPTAIGFQLEVPGWGGPGPNGYPTYYRDEIDTAIVDDLSVFRVGFPGTYQGALSRQLFVRYGENGTSGTVDDFGTVSSGFPDLRLVVLTSGITILTHSYPDNFRYALPTGGFPDGDTITTFDIGGGVATFSAPVDPGWLMSDVLVLGGQAAPAGFTFDFHGDTYQVYNEDAAGGANCWVVSEIPLPRYQLLF